MATKISLKKSSVEGKVPLATDLEIGELAVNLADRKLYSKDSGGDVFGIGGDGIDYTGGTGIDISGATITNTAPHIATNLTYNSGTRLLSSSTGTNVNLPQVTTTVDGLMIAGDKSKLNGMADNATANTGTVTSVSGGAGLTGTVTTTGSLAVDNTVVRTLNESGGGTYAGKVSGTLPTFFFHSTGAAPSDSPEGSQSSACLMPNTWGNPMFAIPNEGEGFYWRNGNSTAWRQAATVDGTYSSLRAQATTKADVGLSNIPNTNGSTANYLRGDGTWVTPPNTTYSTITAAEITTGTATTRRTLTGATAKLIADRNVGTANPAMDGTVRVGTSLLYARQDHRHPVDTSRVAKAGDTMTGMLTVPSLQVTAGSGIGLGTAAPSTSYNLNMADSFSPNGTRASIYSIINVNDGTLSADRTHYGIYNSVRNAYLSAESFTLTQRGAHNEVLNGSADDVPATINTAVGTYSYVRNRATGTVGSAFGAYNYVLNSRAGAITTNAYGQYNQINCSSGSMTNAYGSYVLLRPTNAAATITNGYMFYGTNSTVTGTLTNRYGVYIASTNNNYFAGAVQIGGTAAGGTSRTGLGVGTAPTGAGNVNFTGIATGNGSGLTTLNATNLSSGTVADARLPTTVILTTGNQTMSGLKTFSTALTVTGTSKAGGRFYAGTSNPTNTTRTNYDGNLHAFTFIEPSDIRLKTDITKISSPSEKVSKLNGYTFTMKESGVVKTGVIAQEVLEVLPEAVSGSEEEGYSVAYGNMVGLLIEAIKEQQQQINELKEKVNELTSN